MNTIQEATSTKIIASFDEILSQLRESSTKVPLIDSLEVNCSNPSSDADLKERDVDALISLLEKHRDSLAESLATTVEEDAAYDKALRRYQERYEDAIKEQTELQERLSIQRARHCRVICALEGELSALRDQYDTAARRRAREEQALDASQEEDIQLIQSQHRQQINTLFMQKKEMEEQLHQMQLQHQAEEDAFHTKRQELLDTIDSRASSYSEKMKEIRSQTDYVLSRMNAEVKERQRLQDHFGLIDENERIRLEEEAMLRRVIELEEEAERILNHGATQLQRLYRGIRDRTVVGKMIGKIKGRKSKGGAAKKKKSGRKK